MPVTNNPMNIFMPTHSSAGLPTKIKGYSSIMVLSSKNVFERLLRQISFASRSISLPACPNHLEKPKVSPDTFTGDVRMLRSSR